MASSYSPPQQLMKPHLFKLAPILLNLAGGVLIALAFPPWNQDWLIWVGFVPALAGLLLFPRHWITSLIQGALFAGTFGGMYQFHVCGTKGAS